MSRWHEFFEDGDHRLSMSRLLVFSAFVISSPLVWVIHSAEALGTYLGAFVVNYAAGKMGDAFTKDKTDVSDHPAE